MKKYTIEFIFAEGNFEITVTTNYQFKANDQEHANEMAEKLEIEVSKFLPYPHYDKEQQNISFELESVFKMANNPYFNEVITSKFTFYDETKGDYLTLTLDSGYTLYPVANEECLVDVTKERFVELLEEHYQEYLKNKSMITFDYISYAAIKI